MTWKSESRKLKITFCVFAVVAAVMLGATARGEKKITVKIGSYVTPQSIWGKTVESTIREVKKGTNGEVEIKHLHSGMLGSDRNMLDQVLLGGIQGAGVQTSTLATMVPEVNILELPFLFRDRDEAYYLIDNVISPVLMEKFKKKGLITSSIMENGFMDFVMSGPVHKPEDLKKMKIGSWESPVHIAFWKAQGASPIPIPATEVFNAYARGVVDSGANTASALAAWDRLFGNGLKRDKIFITRAGFTYQAGIIVINKDFYMSMPKKDKEVLERELKKLTYNIRSALREGEEDSYKKLVSMGYHVSVMTPAEKRVFVKNSEVVYKEFEKQIGKGFLKRVLAARAAYRKKHPEGGK